MNRPGVLIIWSAIAMHFSWAVFLFRSPLAFGATPVAALSGMNHYTGAGVFVTVAFLALWALRHHGEPWWVLAAIPQQAFLYLSMKRSLIAMWSEQYADGAKYPLDFIGPDQIWTVWFAVFHTVALVVAFSIQRSAE